MSTPNDPEKAAEQGLRRLAELALDLRGDSSDKAGLVGLCLEQPALDEIVAAFRLHRAAYAAALLKCRAPRAGRFIDELDQRVAERAAEIGRDDAEPRERQPSLRVALGAPSDWPDYSVPNGYQATASGVDQLQETMDGVRATPVCSDPLFVVGVRVDIGTSRESLVLGYRRLASWRQAILPREVAGDARALVAWRGQGLPVNSVNARRVVQWVDACESAGRAEIPCSESTSRLGWHGDLYVCGPDGPIELDDPLGLRSGWRTSGSWEGWCNALAPIAEEPLPWALLFVACVPPLQRDLGLGHNPIVDLSGPRGRGKTTVLRLCGSVYGRPDEKDGGTIVTWDGSSTYLERIAAKSCDVPLLSDETMRVGPRLDMGSTIYALAQGRGKGRGSVEDIRKTATWQTTVISTGEAPVVEFTEASGARARTLSFVATPAISSRSVASRLESGLVVHHGHLGRRLAAWVLAQAPGSIRTRHQFWLERWAESFPEADTRLLSTVAAVEVAAEACRAVGVPAPPATWRESLADALAVSVGFADQSTNALDLLRAELSMHPSAYLRRDPPRDADGNPKAQIEPHGGWRGVIGGREDNWIGFYPPILRRLLADAGHPMTPLLTQWVEEETLLQGTHGRLLEVTIDQRKHRMYCFRQDRVV